MPGDGRSGLQKLLEGISGPGDLAALALGAAGGAVVTVLSGGLDLGSSITAGAGLGIGGWKALVAAVTRRSPKKQVKLLAKLIETQMQDMPDDSGASDRRQKLSRLLNDVNREGDLLQARSLGPEEFAERFKALVARYRQIFETGPGSANPQ